MTKKIIIAVILTGCLLVGCTQRSADIGTSSTSGPPPVVYDDK